MDDNNFVCDLCDKYCGTGDDVPSIVTMTANYGSTEHDGDKLTLRVCGDCIDWLMNSIPADVGEWGRTVPWRAVM